MSSHNTAPQLQTQYLPITQPLSHSMQTLLMYLPKARMESFSPFFFCHLELNPTSPIPRFTPKNNSIASYKKAREFPLFFWSEKDHTLFSKKARIEKKGRDTSPSLGLTFRKPCISHTLANPFTPLTPCPVSLTAHEPKKDLEGERE